MTEPVRYSPHPFEEYCPIDKPYKASWGLIMERHPPEIAMARWNMVWLSTPDIDKVLHLPRSYCAEWDALVARLHFASLVPCWDELAAHAIQHPTRLRTWILADQGSPMWAGSEPYLPVVLDRLDETIAQFVQNQHDTEDGNRVLTLDMYPRREGNVTFFNFRTGDLSD